MQANRYLWHASITGGCLMGVRGLEWMLQWAGLRGNWLSLTALGTVDWLSYCTPAFSLTKSYPQRAAVGWRNVGQGRCAEVQNPNKVCEWSRLGRVVFSGSLQHPHFAFNVFSQPFSCHSLLRTQHVSPSSLTLVPQAKPNRQQKTVQLAFRSTFDPNH